MSRVRVENDQLIISVQGARKFFALKSEMAIPLGNVEGVSIGLTWKDLPKTFDKVAGTNSNLFYYGGTFIQDDDKVWYDLKRAEDAVIISINDEKYKRVIIGVDDPEAIVKLIEDAIK